MQAGRRKRAGRTGLDSMAVRVGDLVLRGQGERRRVVAREAELDHEPDEVEPWSHHLGLLREGRRRELPRSGRGAEEEKGRTTACSTWIRLLSSRK